MLGSKSAASGLGLWEWSCFFDRKKRVVENSLRNGMVLLKVGQKHHSPFLFFIKGRTSGNALLKTLRLHVFRSFSFKVLKKSATSGAYQGPNPRAPACRIHTLEGLGIAKPRILLLKRLARNHQTILLVGPKLICPCRRCFRTLELLCCCHITSLRHLVSIFVACHAARLVCFQNSPNINAASRKWRYLKQLSLKQRHFVPKTQSRGTK